MLTKSVEISFDCLPLRTVGRLDIPMDASPKFRERCESILAAIKKHGSHNSYYLHNAICQFRMTNDPTIGRLTFKFEGAVLTNPEDTQCVGADLSVTLDSETCDWLTEPIVEWFTQTVTEAVKVEFDHYIDAGDLGEAQERLEKMESISDEEGGYMGMYL